MLEIIKDRITKSGVILNDKEILKYIDEPFLVEKDMSLKKEITLEALRSVLLSYPSLLDEYKYLKELVTRGSEIKEDKNKDKCIDYMMRVVDHVGDKKIDSLYVVENGVEYSSSTLVKLHDLYRVNIRYGINRVFEDLNNIEVLVKEYDDDVSLNDFLSTLNIEMDFLTDEEIDELLNLIKK